MVIVPVLKSGGGVSLSVLVPTLPELLGSTFFWQGAFLDSFWSPPRITTSDLLWTTIGF